jgi:capsular exopolysaccharide synthesis family protein
MDTSNGPADSMVTILRPGVAASESYRNLRTNLLYSRLDASKQIILLASAEPGEGKSITCANLGVALAQAGKETLILDCDLRLPTLHILFGISNVHGLGDVLLGDRSLQEVSTEPVPGLKVVAAGPLPPAPDVVLGSARFARFLADAKANFDYVLLDSSPLLAVPDPIVLAAQADGVLLVLDARATRRGSVRRAMRSLSSVGADVLGIIMNKVEASDDGNYPPGGMYGYGYGYGYGDENRRS